MPSVRVYLRTGMMIVELDDDDAEGVLYDTMGVVWGCAATPGNATGLFAGAAPALTKPSTGSRLSSFALIRTKNNS